MMKIKKKCNELKEKEEDEREREGNFVLSKIFDHYSKWNWETKGYMRTLTHTVLETLSNLS